MEGANSLLEIGSAGGQSLRYLSKGLAKGAKIRAIDLGVFPAEAAELAGVTCTEALSGVADELKAQGFDVDVFFGDSHSEEAAQWARSQAPEGYDAVFIDGDHTFEGARQDYNTYGAMGDLVALHDIVNAGCEVRELWNEIKKTRSVRSFVGEGSGMGIGIVRNEPTNLWAPTTSLRGRDSVSIPSASCRI